ncbi:MAG: hypothetical protein ABRQ39_22930 [Candidatus Eremiobacterota bacterium]
MSKKKKKKKIKQVKVDISSLDRENIKEELLTSLKTINSSCPSQKQIELVTKKLFHKLGSDVKIELINLLKEATDQDRERIVLAMMDMEGEDTEELIKELLASDQIKPEVKAGLFCILLGQDLADTDIFPIMLRDGSTLQNQVKNWCKLLKEDPSSQATIEKAFHDLSLTNKFLTLYFILAEEGTDFYNIFLNSNIPKLRWQFASKFLNMSPSMVPILLKLREDKDSDVRAAAKRSIGILKDKGVDFSGDIKELPLYCCYAGKNIKESGLGTVLIARKLKDHYINYALFLIDVWGMGLKDVFGERKCHKFKFDREILPRIKSNSYVPVVEEDITVAKKLIFGGVEYAKKNGFKIPREFLRWRDIAGKLSEEEKDYKDLFGKNGEVLVMASPGDLMERIIWEDDKEEYYEEHKGVKPDHSLEELIEKLNSRGIKFVTPMEKELTGEIWDKMDLGIQEKEREDYSEEEDIIEEEDYSEEEDITEEEDYSEEEDITEEENYSEEEDITEEEDYSKEDITAEKEKTEGDHLKPAAEKEKTAGDHLKPAAEKEKTAGDHLKPAAEKEKTAGDHLKPAAEKEKTAGDHLKPAAEKEKTAGDHLKPAAEKEKTAGDHLKPAAENMVSQEKIDSHGGKKIFEQHAVREKSRQNELHAGPSGSKKPPCQEENIYKKKEKKEDFDLDMERMYDDLEEFIYMEQYDKSYIHLEKMLRKATGTSWEEDVLKDLLSFSIDNFDYYDKYLYYSRRLESFYKSRGESELLLVTKLDRADYLASTGKVDDGLSIYNNIINENPDAHIALIRLAYFYMDADMIDNGVKTYKKIINMKEKVDIEILADAIVDLLDIIEEYNLTGEDREEYMKIAREMNIEIYEEPEVLVVGKKE